MAVFVSTLGGGSDGVRNVKASLCEVTSLLVSSSDGLDGVADGKFRGAAVGTDVEVGSGWGTACEQARAMSKTSGKKNPVLARSTLIMIPASLDMSPGRVNSFSGCAI